MSVTETKMKLKKINEYPDNPRKNELAVDAVAQSIRRYGYNQPIVVDKDNTVIVGHTRLKALKKLVDEGVSDYEEITVLKSDMEADEAGRHRIADNKSSEKAEWYLPYLRAEVRAMGEEAKEVFEPSELESLLESELGRNETWQVTEEDIERQRQRMLEHQAKMADEASSQDSGISRLDEKGMVNVKCETCGEEFAVRRSNALESARQDEDKRSALEDS